MGRGMMVYEDCLTRLLEEVILVEYESLTLSEHFSGGAMAFS